MKSTYAIVTVCALLTVVLMVFGFSTPTANESSSKPVYALVLPEDIGTGVLQLRQGAQTAATEAGVELKTYIAEQSSAIEPQLTAFLATVGQLEVDGIILGECPAAILEEAERIALSKEIPLILLWNQDSLAAITVAGDDEAQGRLLAEACLEQGLPISAAYAFLDGSARSAARLQGLMATLGQELTVYQNLSQEEMTAMAGTIAEGSAAFALTAEATRALAEAGHGRFALWGMDPGDSRVTTLEEGWAEGLLMEMPYAQGYLAVTAASKTKEARPETHVTAPSRVVTKDTMYLSENVKLVFPLLQ